MNDIHFLCSQEPFSRKWNENQFTPQFEHSGVFNSKYNQTFHKCTSGIPYSMAKYYIKEVIHLRFCQSTKRQEHIYSFIFQFIKLSQYRAKLACLHKTK